MQCAISYVPVKRLQCPDIVHCIYWVY